MFRAMELGGQVIAPLALILALSEVAAKSTAARFCARLYIPALGVVAVVVLAMDQLAQVTFTKAWPDPAVFYQVPPNYVLMFAIGPATAHRRDHRGRGRARPLRAAALERTAASPAHGRCRSSAAGLSGARPACCLPGEGSPAGGVGLRVAVHRRGCARLAGRHAVGRVRPAAPQGRASQSPDGWGAYGGLDRTGDFGRLEESAEGGVYRGDGLYRPGSTGRAGADQYGRDRDDAGPGWQDDRDARRSGREDWRSDQRQGEYQVPDFATGDFVPGDYGSGDYADGGNAGGDYADGDYATGDFATGDVAPNGRDLAVGGWQTRPGAADRLPAAGGIGDEAARAQLFGQIAIYTVLEDRVDEFDQLTERIVDQVRSREPDTLVFIVHAVPSAPMQRILYEVYRDRSAYQWHNQQAHVQQFEADKRPVRARYKRDRARTSAGEGIAVPVGDGFVQRARL